MAYGFNQGKQRQPKFFNFLKLGLVEKSISYDNEKAERKLEEDWSNILEKHMTNILEEVWLDVKVLSQYQQCVCDDVQQCNYVEVYEEVFLNVVCHV